MSLFKDTNSKNIPLKHTFQFILTSSKHILFQHSARTKKKGESNGTSNMDIETVGIIILMKKENI